MVYIILVDAQFIDKIEKKYPGPKCLWNRHVWL